MKMKNLKILSSRIFILFLIINSIQILAQDQNTMGKTEWFDPNKPATTYCNPINIGYNYTTHNHNGISDSRRSSADPVIINYKGDYYLFATNQAGFFLE